MFLDISPDKKTYEAMKNELEQEWTFKVGDIQGVKNEKRSITYLTKEDKQPRFKGVDVDLFHINYKVSSIAEQRRLRPLNYPLRSILVNYRRRVHEEHAAWLESEARSEEWRTTIEYKNDDLEEVIERCTKKGIYIYDPAVCGKTTMVKCLLMTDFMEYKYTSNFPFTSYNGQSNILMDEFTEEHYAKHRETILSLAGGMATQMEIKGGDITSFVLPEKLYLLSNYPWPTELAFMRRFDLLEIQENGTIIKNGQTIRRGTTLSKW